MQQKRKIVNRTLKKFIEIYQALFSPDHSFWAPYIFPFGYCKYHPTCSEYAKESLKKNTIRGALTSTVLRVIRCNPWSKGGFDYPIRKS